MKLPALLFFCLSVLALPASGATVLFDLQGNGGSGLLRTNEFPTVPPTGGSGGEIAGGISYDDVLKVLTVNVGWGSGNGFTDLTGSVTGMHIHAPGGFSQAAGVLISLNVVNASNMTTSTNSTSGTSGFITGTTRALTGAEEANLLNGLFYINVHTSTNSGGEIRGNLVQVPEPGRFLLALGGIGVMILRRRRAIPAIA